MKEQEELWLGWKFFDWIHILCMNRGKSILLGGCLAQKVSRDEGAMMVGTFDWFGLVEIYQSILGSLQTI